MQIERITLRNFRCFGPEAVTVSLRAFTAFVGGNGCGKTALLQALARLFGIVQSDRSLAPDDFHIPEGRTRQDFDPGEKLALSIDVVLRFPELGEEGKKPAVAECFRQMMLKDGNCDPYCRVRLEGTWTRTNTPEGDVDQRLLWVLSDKEEPEDEHKHSMSAHERALVHVHYVPALREPAKQVRFVSGSMIGRLFSAVDWPEDTTDAIEEASEKAQVAFADANGVKAIHDAISGYWSLLHPGKAYSGVALRPIATKLEELLMQMQAVFAPAPGGGEAELNRLSDGLKSLFYLSLIIAGFEIETAVVRGDESAKHFDTEKVNAPSLTVFAVEEPENHIAPHYLGRIIAAIRKALSTGRAQALLTSHSPSVMERVNPREVRHMRLRLKSNTASVNELTFPDTKAEEFKYIREAVRAHSELYFSRLVLLGEGDSEEIVLKKLSAAMGVEIDLSFVSIVPLGGRHVNHFWRLLNGLQIPHLTLLDLDIERHGGGWGRIQYAIKELIAVGVPRKKLLALEGGRVMDDKELEEMRGWASDPKVMKGWINSLEGYGVYFSDPLDFDFLLMESYPDAYKQVPEGADGPELPEKDDAVAYEQVIRSVLKPKGGSGETYSDGQKEAFFWYRYLFLGRGKPVSHLEAMSRLTKKQLEEGCPPVLKRLCDAMTDALDLATETQADAE